MSGRLMRIMDSETIKGLNLITLHGLDNLASGTYLLEVSGNDTNFRTKVTKTN